MEAEDVMDAELDVFDCDTEDGVSTAVSDFESVPHDTKTNNKRGYKI